VSKVPPKPYDSYIGWQCFPFPFLSQTPVSAAWPRIYWASASRRVAVFPSFRWYSLHLPTEGWPGWVELVDREAEILQYVRVRPKFGFGFGYGAETDLTYGFGLVSATAKVHWHNFGLGRNITPKRRNRRNCKIGSNFNTVAVWQLGYWL